MLNWQPLELSKGQFSPFTKRCKYRGWTLTQYTCDEDLSDERMRIAFKEKLTDQDRVRLKELNELINTPSSNATKTYMAHKGAVSLRSTTEEELLAIVDSGIQEGIHEI